MIQLFGHPASTYTRKVLMTLAETKTPFTFNLVDFAKGEHKQQPHMSRQPFGRVPALQDDGFEMFESRAMCRYIDQKAGGVLMPTELKARARVEQWVSVETSEFTPHAMKFVYQHVFRRPQEQAVLDNATQALGVTLGFMNGHLAKNTYLTGDQFTLADVCFMPYVEYVMGSPAKSLLEPHVHVMGWWNRVRERPTWRAAITQA
jgi:glutathione S-transferase